MSDLTLTWPGHKPEQSALSEKGEMNKLTPSIVLPNEAKVFRVFGDEIHFHLSGGNSGGQYTVFTSVTPPGGGPPPHYHNNEDEWFIPLEGEAEFFLSGSWHKVPLRSVVFVPRGTVHAFKNCGDSALKLLTHTAPSGLETYFERCAAEFAKPGPPDMARIVEISAEHGIHFVKAGKFLK